MDVEGVDLEWVRAKLYEYLSETSPVGDYAEPRGGRERAVALGEVVHPIFARLYPEWRAENPGTTSSYDSEFDREREAATKLLARLDSFEEVAERLGSIEAAPQLSAASLHPRVWQAAQAQWSLGQPHEAVLAAAKIVNSMLQQRTGRTDVSEQDLVRQTFGHADPQPGKPRLRYPEIEDDQTRSSMEQGVMNFGAGCFGAIRNPVTHRPNDEIELDEQTALEQLAAFSLVARWIDRAILVEAQ